MKTTAAVVAILFGVAGIASAHGSHDQEAMVDPADDWALYHMQEEHRMYNDISLPRPENSTLALKTTC